MRTSLIVLSSGGSRAFLSEQFTGNGFSCLDLGAYESRPLQGRKYDLRGHREPRRLSLG